MTIAFATSPAASQDVDSLAGPLEAGQAQDASELAKQLSNPVASLVSVPFQANWEFGVGRDGDEATRFLVNFQPVLPFTLDERWTLITRIIVPLLSQPPLVSGAEATFGVSDITLSFFFTPLPKGFVWAVGPAFLLPTTSDPFLGTEKWGIGPTALVLKQAGPWTVGMLTNHIWSFAGGEDRPDVNQTFLQPFVAHNWPGGYTFTLQSETTANWEVSDDAWTVPVNLLFTKVVKLGKKPLSVGGGVGAFVASPERGPDWKIRTVVTLLFPR